MRKPTSIKTRITIWYTSLMFVLILIVLSLVGGLSYQLSLENIEKDVTLQVTQISDQLSKRQPDVFSLVDNEEEFRNVSIYTTYGKHIVGQYIYDITNIEFKQGAPRKETVGGKDYIIYDIKHPSVRGGHNGFWIRGAESVNSTMLLGRSAIIIILIIIPLLLFLTAVGG